MRSVRVLGILAFIFLFAVIAAAGTDFGVRDINYVTFVAPMRVGDALLPAGEYVVRHTMEGQEHVMVFQAARGKGHEVKAKCTLVPLTRKADRTSTIYQLNAASERVLQELVFQGETAKHVF